MSSFSLRPRLLILLHKGRQLMSTLKAEVSQLPCTHCFASSVELFSQKTYRLKSKESLHLPDEQGRCAQAYIDLSAWQPDNAAQYLLPDFTLSFFPPGEAEPLAITLPGESCQTYAQGQAHKQVITYWATLLQCDLEMLGWQVQPQTKGILLTATAPRAGWNVKGTFTQRDARLSVPGDISSWDHVVGELPLLVWGPYQMADKMYVCRIPYGVSWCEEDVQNALQQDLLRQGFTGAISWEKGHLCLELPVGTSVQALHPLTEGHGVYALEGQSARQTLDISFRLNGKVYKDFETVQSLSDVLSLLNQQAEGQQLRFLCHEERLCIEALDAKTPLQLDGVSPHAQQYLGLVPLDLSSPDLEYNKRVEQVVEWLELARQYVPLLESEAVLQDLLRELSQDVSLFRTNPEAWEAALTSFLNVLDEWMVRSERAQANPLWHLEVIEPNVSSSTPQSLAEKKKQTLFAI